MNAVQSNGGVIQPAPLVLHPLINASQSLSAVIAVDASLQLLALQPTT